MNRAEIDEIVDMYEKKARNLMEQAKEEVDKRTQGLKEVSDEKKGELESTLKDIDERFQKELDSLDMERKRILEIGKIKAEGLEDKVNKQIEDSKLRLKTEYRKVREDLLNR